MASIGFSWQNFGFCKAYSRTSARPITLRRESTSTYPANWRSAFALRGQCSECVRGRLPFPETLRDELGPLFLAPTVEHLEVRRVGSNVDAGGSGIHTGVAIRPCRPVSGGAVGSLHPDLAGALDWGYWTDSGDPDASVPNKWH